MAQCWGHGRNIKGGESHLASVQHDLAVRVESATPALMCDSFCDPGKVTQTLLLFLFLSNLGTILPAVFPCC